MLARKEPKTYVTPPRNYTKRENIKVGLLNHNFAAYPGPQRNRPQDSSKYRVSLASRAKAYGPFSWVLLRDRVVSRRADGVLYPLDGNGSNHWLEIMFGPNFEVPCIVVDDLSLPDENRLFQRLQDNKKVTPTERYRTDLEYDQGSLAAKVQQALPEGFHITQSPLDPFGLGRTTAEWIVRKYGAKALTETLNVTTSLFSEREPARTNGALLRALAVLFNNADERESYDLGRLLALLREAGPATLSSYAHGNGGEGLVLIRIRQLYEEAPGPAAVS
jgi:hypothetical protein